MFDLPLGGVAAGELGLLLAAAFVAGLSRGFSGFGAALIFVPLASAAIGPRLAAPLLLIIDSSTTLGLVPGAWRLAAKRDVAWMTVGGVVGVPLGAWILTRADPLALRWALCLLVVALLALLASGWRYRARPAAPLTIGVGGLAGVFSGAAQVGGPPVVAYWLGATVAPDRVRANIILYFAVSSVLTAASYFLAGLLTRQLIVLALLTGPLFGLGLLLGTRLFGKASEHLFRRICYGLIALAALLGLPAFDGVLH